MADASVLTNMTHDAYKTHTESLSERLAELKEAQDAVLSKLQKQIDNPTAQQDMNAKLERLDKLFRSIPEYRQRAQGCKTAILDIDSRMKAVLQKTAVLREKKEKQIVAAHQKREKERERLTSGN
ncbi:hypothetical protein J8273_1069 [Carpediemonas membranifera]|uniref:Uncharacterized protein n=1 Tax=Carpediemonas membranifera TaxID=201153 RepID=A0A8J6B1A2_9EUKA|nr:hypothetical protein J8273_1069 [Carpediemonas membranifera]|eukprot:KAG9397160.1 hypothetical protein J8273_1069 [Carpediemonas membranifera]